MHTYIIEEARLRARTDGVALLPIGFEDEEYKELVDLTSSAYIFYRKLQLHNASLAT